MGCMYLYKPVYLWNLLPIYVRKGKARSPVRMMFGPGIEALFKAQKNDEIMQQVVRDRFAAEFARNLKFYVKRMFRR